jgi:hypothetical protein
MPAVEAAIGEETLLHPLQAIVGGRIEVVVLLQSRIEDLLLPVLESRPEQEEVA